MLSSIDSLALDRVIRSSSSVQEITDFLSDPVNKSIAVHLAREALLSRRDAWQRSQVRRVETKAAATVSIPAPVAVPPKPLAAVKISAPQPGTETRKEYDKIPESEKTVDLKKVVASGFPRQYIQDTEKLTPRTVSEAGKTWMNTTIEGKAWIETNEEEARRLRAATRQAERIEAMKEAEYARIRGMADTRLKTNISESISSWAKELRVQWTSELLGKTFDLDGRTILWADATVEDHRGRLDWLKKHTEGTIRTAALHLKAIELIQETKATSLAQATA